MEQKIFTFGYGNRTSYDDLSKFIDENSIVRVIDVRLRPTAWTRRWHGVEIEKFCQSQDVSYDRETALGNTSGKRDWLPPDEVAAKEAIEKVAELIRSDSGSILLLCAELDSKRCHRSEVASRLNKVVGLSVEHLR
jgi:hypothetical protein